MNVKTLRKLGNYIPKDTAEFPLRLNLQQRCYESLESAVSYVFSFIKLLTVSTNRVGKVHIKTGDENQEGVVEL